MFDTSSPREATTSEVINKYINISQIRGKVCHSISIQSTYFVRQLSLQNVTIFIFVSVTPLYSSGGPLNMAAVGFSFPKIYAQSRPNFEISGLEPVTHSSHNFGKVGSETKEY